MGDDPSSYLDYAGSPSGTIEYLMLVVLAVAVVYIVWGAINKKWDE